MQAQTKLAGVIGQDGSVRRGGERGGDREVATVEVDTTFARVVGLGEGMKVCLSQSRKEGLGTRRGVFGLMEVQ